MITKGKNDLEKFLLRIISNYEARTKKRIFKFGPYENKLSSHPWYINLNNDD
jgi:hypothetical protein